MKITINDIIYALNEEDKTADIIRCESNKEIIYIPRSILYENLEYIVTRISESSFQDIDTIKSIQFPPNSELRLIGQSAFSGSSIESIQIPTHVTQICKSAFNYCENLQYVSIQNDSELQIIEKKAFSNTSIEILSIPSDIIELKNGWCCQLKEIKEIKIIKREQQNIALYNNNILIGKSDIKSDVFDVFLFVPKEIKSFTIPPFIKRIGSYSFSETSIESIFIPSQVTHICKGAFFYCKMLQKIQFQENSELQIIEKNAFYETQIDSIVIPSNLSELKDGWCNGTTKLVDVKMMPNNKYFKIIDDKMIIGKTDKKSDEFDNLVFVCRNAKDVTIPPFIKSISSYSFSESLIESIVIPQKVTHINKGAFLFCENLKSCKIPENSELQIIEKEAFCYCNIDSIFIPQTVTKIAEEAFNSCGFNFIYFSENVQLQMIEKKVFSDSKLEYILIPSSVTNICKNAFAWCTKLKQIDLPHDTKLKIIESKAFYSSQVEVISIPSDIIELEKGWCQGTNKLNEIKIIQRKEQNISLSNDNLLLGKKDKKNIDFDVLLFVPRNAKKVIIPSSITKINSYSFYESLIENVSIPPQVTHIGEQAFYNCINIQQFEIPKNSQLRLIDNFAFQSSSIENIFIPSHVTKISKGLFSYCRQIRKIEFSDNSMIQTIEKNAFHNSSLECISIPSSITELKDGWCSSSYKLNKVHIMPNNKNYKNLDDIFVIGKSDIKSGDFDTIVFVSRNVKNVIIPPFIKIINSYSFSCLPIERISIPSNVTVIGKGAFQYCMKLEKIEIPSNSKIKKIGKYAFLNCQFRSILIPSNASIYIDDFNYNKLQIIEFSDYLEITNIEKELFGQPFNAIIMVPQKRK